MTKSDGSAAAPDSRPDASGPGTSGSGTLASGPDKASPAQRSVGPARVTYRDAGVDIDAKYDAVESAQEHIRSTFTKGVLADIGLFGGIFDLKAVGMRDPVLVASTDGVGTKVKVARLAQRFDTVGQCLVNHCVNDILVQGARPLFFLDYIAMSKMDGRMVRGLIEGMAIACRENDCALIGGETAEMPGVYAQGEFDLAGTIVGAAERATLLTGQDVRVGDVVLALPSTGLHTNGYSLANKVLFDVGGLGVDSRSPLLPGTVGDALLAVHRSYYRAVWPLLGRFPITAMAHVTGGGLCDNVPRVLPAGTMAEIHKKALPVPPIMQLIRQVGNTPEDECYKVLNMGFGYVLIMRPDAEAAVLTHLRERGETVVHAGRILPGDQTVRLV